MMLMADYAHRETALEIRQDDDGYSLQLRADLAELVHILIPSIWAPPPCAPWLPLPSSNPSAKPRW